MNRTDLEDLINHTFIEVKKINQTKGREYADDEEALRNFKKNAELVGVDPKQVWAIFFMKHVDALVTFAKEGQVKSEPVETRVYDVILYAALLLGLVADEDDIRQPDAIKPYEPTRLFDSGTPIGQLVERLSAVTVQVPAFERGPSND